MNNYNEGLKARINTLMRERRISRNKLAGEGVLSQKAINNQLSDNINDRDKAPVSMELVMLLLDKFPDVSAEWLLKGVGQSSMQNVVVGEQNMSNAQNSAINDTESVRALVAQLAEKDKQIYRLMDMISKKPIE
jgi:hypothetical protein